MEDRKKNDTLLFLLEGYSSHTDGHQWASIEFQSISLTSLISHGVEICSPVLSDAQRLHNWSEATLLVYLTPKLMPLPTVELPAEPQGPAPLGRLALRGGTSHQLSLPL